jgi:signal transduction histidine kinase/CheY-like chemotaxis protein
MQSMTFNPYDEVIKTFVKQEQTNRVLGLLKSTLIMQSIFVVSCAFVFRDIVSMKILMCWVAAQYAIFLMRILVTYWFFTVKKLTVIDVNYTLATFLLCFCNSLLWGISAFFLDFQQYPEESVLLITINLGIGVGSTGIGGYWFKYFIAYTTPYVCLFIASFLYGVPNPNITLGILFGLFAVFLTRVVYTSYQNNIDNLLLRRKNELLAKSHSSFLAAASHDLRQPLQALNLFLSALEQEESSPRSRALLQHLHNSSDALNGLLNQILDVSKLDSNALQTEQKAFSLSPIIQRLSTTLEVCANQKGIGFQMESGEFWVKSDAALVERLLANLLDNAVNYTHEGNVLLNVFEDPDGMINICIEDSGIGMSEEQQLYIFEEFYQVNNQARNSKKGVGLGLSIVKRICNLLDIPLGMQSQLGVGTTFTLILPAAEPVEQTLQDNNTHLACDLDGRCVLVVEDNDDVRLALKKQLELWGVRILSANSMEGALNCLHGHLKPELILSDYRIADNQTGVEVIESVKKYLSSPMLPSIILSGDTSPERLDEMQALGHTLLHKPVKTALLKSMLYRKLNVS